MKYTWTIEIETTSVQNEPKIDLVKLLDAIDQRSMSSFKINTVKESII